jgi:hypothetical protein
MRVFLFVCAVIGFPAICVSQTLNQRIAACATLTDPQKMKECGEKLAEDIGSGKTQQTMWQRHDAILPVEQTKVIGFSIQARNPVSGSAAFIIRCIGIELDMSIQTNFRVKPNEVSNVYLRWGNSAPTEQKWNPLNDAGGIGASLDEKRLDVIPENGTFAIRISDFAGQPHEFEFQLDGIALPKKVLREECKK